MVAKKIIAVLATKPSSDDYSGPGYKPFSLEQLITDASCQSLQYPNVMAVYNSKV